MENRIYNFSAGPAIIPEEVLLEAQKDLFMLPGVGMSIMEISHRSKTYDAIHAEAKEGLKSFWVFRMITQYCFFRVVQAFSFR